MEVLSLLHEEKPSPSATASHDEGSHDQALSHADGSRDLDAGGSHDQSSSHQQVEGSHDQVSMDVDEAGDKSHDRAPSPSHARESCDDMPSSSYVAYEGSHDLQQDTDGVVPASKLTLTQQKVVQALEDEGNVRIISQYLELFKCISLELFKHTSLAHT